MSRRSQSGIQDFGSDSFLDIIANIVGILIILIVIAGMKVAHQSAEILPAAATTADAPETSVSADAVASFDNLRPEDLTQQELPVEAASPDSFTTPQNIEDLSLPAQLTDAFEDPVEPVTPPEPPVEPAPDMEQLLSQLDTVTAERVKLQEELVAMQLATDETTSEIEAARAQQAALRKELEARQITRNFATERRDLILKEQDRLQQRIDDLEQTLSERGDDRQRVENTLKGLTRRQKYVTDALDQIAMETRQLREVLLETPVVPEPQDRLNHRIRPVSRAVETAEEHFRLANGRIAHIPLEGLLERLRQQITQKTSIVRRFRRAEGVVGPVGGFRMNYVVERQSADPIQALKYGQSGYRISVSRWTIVPAETLAAESVDDALRMGSRFRQVIEATSPDTVLTIWLYPGDFEHFGKLRELAHRLNLRVAARPLPDGTPIAGSPNGSRSASQ